MVAVLAEVQSPSGLPALQVLRADVDEEEEREQVDALRLALRSACAEREITLITSWV